MAVDQRGERLDRRAEDASQSSSWSSSSVKTSLAADFGFVRLTIVNQKTRQPTMHNTAIKFVSRAAVRSARSSRRLKD
jgi:hypothetical protein